MKLLLSILILFLFIGTSEAQNPEGFDKMASNMAGKKAPIIKKDELVKLQAEKKEIIYLDTREWKEYQVSHLKGAIWVGYDKLDETKFDKLDKDATIVVYCSVGYRSGKVTEKLQKLGFKKAKNLYGGLFNWANNGGKITNGMGVQTNELHGFNSKWSKWINTDRCQVVL